MPVRENVVISPVDLRIIKCIAEGSDFQILINNGFSHWQIASGIERIFDAGLIIRAGRGYTLSEAGSEAVRISIAKQKRGALAPLDEFRLANPQGPATVEIGRQIVAQIRDRVSS